MKIPTGEQLKVLRVLSTSGRELTGAQVSELDPTIKLTTVYVSLLRLVEKGLVGDRKDAKTTEPGAPRRWFRITGLGQRALKLAEIAEQVEVNLGPVIVPGGTV